jgi:hypothetical protein
MNFSEMIVVLVVFRSSRRCRQYGVERVGAKGKIDQGNWRVARDVSRSDTLFESGSPQ